MVKAIDSSLPVSFSHAQQFSRNTVIIIALAAISAVIYLARSSLVGRVQALPTSKDLHAEGLELMKKGQNSLAILKFTLALESTTDSQSKAQFYFDRAMARLKEGEVQWALKDLDSAEDCQPLDKTLRFNIYYQRAEAREREASGTFYTGARERLEDYKAALALALDKDKLELNQKIGLLYLKYDAKQASQYFTAALACNPSDKVKVAIQRDRAKGYQAVNKYKEALADLEAIDINQLDETEMKDHHFSKGLVYLELYNPEEAFKEFSVMLKPNLSDEDTTKIYYHLALVKAQQSNVGQESAQKHSFADDAIRYLNESLKGAQEKPGLKLSILLLMGELHYRIGNLDGAKKDFSNAYDISHLKDNNHDSTSLILLEKGKICLELGEITAAASSFAEGIVTAYHSVMKGQFYYYLGILAEKQNEMNLARQFWTKSLKCGLSDSMLRMDVLAKLGLTVS